MHSKGVIKLFGRCDNSHPIKKIHDSFSVRFKKNSSSGPASSYNWNIDKKKGCQVIAIVKNYGKNLTEKCSLSG